MKGIVFNLLESFVCEGWGDEKYEEILALCPLKTKKPFVGPGTYPDSDLMAIALKASEILEVDLPDALRAFGRYSFPRLAQRFPQFVVGHDRPMPFLLSVEDVIHIEIKKLFPNAVTPSFTYRGVSDDRLVIEYRSRRKLCSFMEGLLDGVAGYYECELRYEQNVCMHNGADHCEFSVAVQSSARRPA